MKLGFLLTSIFIAFSTQASVYCDDQFSIYVKGQNILDTGYTLPKKGVFTAADREVIRNILEDNSKSPEERWHLIDRKYLQARLRIIPLWYRAQFLKVLSQLQPTFGYSSQMIAHSGQVKFPNVLKGTPIPSLILAHELEHLIQFLSRNVAQSQYFAIAINSAYSFNPHTVFRFEAEALQAEWEIYSLIGDREGEAALAAIQNKFIDAKDLISFILRNRNFDRDEYVQRQHGIGRYSMTQATQMTQVNVLRVFSPYLFPRRRF